MKSLIILAALAISSQAFSVEVTCRGDRAIQAGGQSNIKADADFKFELNAAKNEISKVVGHIFVNSAYADNEEINQENSYMGFFKIDSLKANPNYRPITYKGYTQFKDFDATHTTGQEEGMYGALVLDLKKGSKFEGRYIFQAGDHMGGTVLLNCRTK